MTKCQSFGAGIYFALVPAVRVLQKELAAQ